MRGMTQLVTAILLSFVLCWGQNYIEVWPGEGTLSEAIDQAQDGDVLILSSGSEYTESTQRWFGTIINKSLTITTDYEDKAIVRLLKVPPSPDSAYAFFRLSDNAALTLKGLELDGQNNASYLVQYFLEAAGTPTLVRKIQVQDCFVHDFLNNVFHGMNSAFVSYLVVDSTIVDNTVFNRTGTLVHYKYCGSNYIAIKNSTIATVTSYGIRISGPGYTDLPNNTPEVVIDHTTWYNIGTTDQREIILGEQPPLFRPWKITNSIFVDQVSRTGSTRKKFINIKSDANSGSSNVGTITNILFWDIDDVNFYSHTVKDTIRRDPEFSAPEEYDFTLTRNSIAYHIAGDGSKAIGDLRWATATNIAPPPFKKLTLTINGNGRVSVDPQPVIIQFYEPGTVVNLLAQPDSLYEFDSWSGDLSGTDSVASLTMDADKNVVAKFVLKSSSLTTPSLPAQYSLAQNHPNPFNATTVIKFTLQQAGLTTLSVYDLLGKEVLRLVNQPLSAGQHQVTLTSNALPTGVYFYKLTSGSFTDIKKMILLK